MINNIIYYIIKFLFDIFLHSPILSLTPLTPDTHDTYYDFS